ncbi:MAG: acyl-CoA dehydrogenase [Acidobacteria bacterium]|nr:MAG: acyl-CoA dehydrogenase [Acidobacteriota bacterium]
MDFSFTPEQEQYRKEVIRFGRERLGGSVRELDRKEEFDRQGWRECGQFGIQGLPVPEQYGGSAADILTTVVALEALGYACRDNGLLFSLGAHIWACELPLFNFGTESQKEKYLARLASGEWIGALAMAEPEAGSDAFSIKTTAIRKGDSYLLNGSKSFVTNGPLADLMLVVASLDPSKGWQALTAFLLEKKTAGVTVHPQEKMGLRSSTLGEVFFEDCEVSAGDRLGEEGVGAAIFTHAMECERAFILSTAVGTMERVLERCVDYAKQRRQFGKPIGKFQLVASKLVDMRVRLETARNLLYRVAWLKSMGKSVFAEAAMAKLHISESWVASCLDAVQVFGGYGYLTDLEMERELRDALGSRIFSGTSEIQRNLIAQLMGL